MFERRHFGVQVSLIPAFPSSDLLLGAARGCALVEYIVAHLAILWLGVLAHGQDLDVRKTPLRSASEPYSRVSFFRPTSWRG